MGTRADFYVGKGKDAEWLGSVAWDGYPGGLPQELFKITDPEKWYQAIHDLLTSREDGTLPKDGWPWHWEDSQTTDYAYTFTYDSKKGIGKVWACCFGYAWFDPLEEEPEHDGPKTVEFPNMKDRQDVTFGKRSGVMIFRS